MTMYSVCVRGEETYDIYAKNEKDAIIKAIDCFFDDDEHYGEEATEDECEITWEEEV